MEMHLQSQQEKLSFLIKRRELIGGGIETEDMLIFSHLRLYLSKWKIIFVQIAKCIVKFQKVLVKLQNVFVKEQNVFVKEQYVFVKFQNIFVKLQNVICRFLSFLIRKKADERKIERNDVFIFSPETFLLNSFG